MKKVVLVLAAMSALILGGCPSNNSNNNPASVPQTACAPGQPVSAYCTSYNPGAYGYGYYPYGGGSNGYYPYGGTGYGCPYGYQPMYTGGYSANNYTCVSSGYFGGYGYNPYYPSGYTWPNGYYGYGPAQMCDTYVAGSCGADPTLRCVPAFGTRYGYCARN